MESSSLIEYRARVERAAAAKTGEPIYNSTTEHAQIVVQSLFETAQSEVVVLNECVNDAVMGHDSTMKAIGAFLDRPGTAMRVLVEDQPPCWQDRKFIKQFFEHENVEILLAPEHLRQTYGFHFTVADRQSYRFEPDKAKHSAVAAFGGEATKTARHLASLFEQLWPYGEKLELDQSVA